MKKREAKEQEVELKRLRLHVCLYEADFPKVIEKSLVSWKQESQTYVAFVRELTTLFKKISSYFYVNMLISFILM